MKSIFTVLIITSLILASLLLYQSNTSDNEDFTVHIDRARYHMERGEYYLQEGYIDSVEVMHKLLLNLDARKAEELIDLKNQ